MALIAQIIGCRIICGLWGLIVRQTGERRIGKTCGLTNLRLGKALTFALENQFGIVNQRHAVGLRKLFGARTDKIHVRTLLKHETRRVNGISQALDASHAARFHSSAIHQERVELDASVGSKKTASAGVEGGIVFEDGDGSLYCVDSRATARKDLVADFKRMANAGFMSRRCFWGDSPGAAVNEKSRVVSSRLGGHSDMVVHRAPVNCQREKAAVCG